MLDVPYRFRHARTTMSQRVVVTVDTLTMEPYKNDPPLAQTIFEAESRKYDKALCSDGSYKDGVASLGITDGQNRWLYRIDNYMGHINAELIAILQALRLSMTEFSNHPRTLLVASDCKNILDGFDKARGKSGLHQYAVAINYVLSSFQNPCEITLMWVPGHKGVQMNVIADDNARDARQLPEDAVLRFPVALWSRKTRSFKREPSDLLYYADGTDLAKHRDTDQMLYEIQLGCSFLNADNGSDEFPEFSWCELCRNEQIGVPQTADHIFLKCTFLDAERQLLKDEFSKHQIPFGIRAIIKGYCIDGTADFLNRVVEMKNTFKLS